jgi:hypothetical protein
MINVAISKEEAKRLVAQLNEGLESEESEATTSPGEEGDVVGLVPWVKVGSAKGKPGDTVKVVVTGSSFQQPSSLSFVAGFWLQLSHWKAQLEAISVELGPFFSKTAFTQYKLNNDRKGMHGTVIVSHATTFKIDPELVKGGASTERGEVLINPGTILATISYKIAPGVAPGKYPISPHITRYGGKSWRTMFMDMDTQGFYPEVAGGYVTVE